MAHTYDPSYSGRRDQEDQDSSPNPWQKVLKTPSQPTAGQGGSSLSSQLRGRLRLGTLWLQANLGKTFMRPHPNRKSWAWRCIPVIPRVVRSRNREQKGLEEWLNW
jgi:hypothetical protein